MGRNLANKSPDNQAEIFHNFLQNKLEHYFPELSVKIARRTIVAKCYYLVRTFFISENIQQHLARFDDI